MAVQDFDVLVESRPEKSIVDAQVCAMFDAPVSEKLTERFVGKCPDWDEDFSVGLIVGPSGSGKSTIARHIFGAEFKKQWVHNKSVVSQFQESKIDDVTRAFSSVGFNTIPSWVKPREVLSNGEGFRVDTAAALLSGRNVMVDEFTSVVDRQVAEVACYSVAKHVRDTGKKLVAVTCHYDVEEWLQPDWVLDMATRQLTRRLLHPRKPKTLTIGQISRNHWETFSRYHYMTADLHPAAKCYGSFLSGRLVGFHAIMHRPVSGGIREIQYALSRTVVLPDYQGLGVNRFAVDEIASAFHAFGHRLRTTPAHPALVRSYNKNKNYRLCVKPGTSRGSKTSLGTMGERPCAVFEYIGPKMADLAMARDLISWSNVTDRVCT